MLESSYYGSNPMSYSNNNTLHVTVNGQPARIQPVTRGAYTNMAFNDKWKIREPMKGEWEHPFCDICWNTGDCCVFCYFPCIYTCGLTQAISKTSKCLQLFSRKD
jgi:hypothetical protein